MPFTCDGAKVEVKIMILHVEIHYLLLLNKIYKILGSIHPTCFLHYNSLKTEIQATASQISSVDLEITVSAGK